MRSRLAVLVVCTVADLILLAAPPARATAIDPAVVYTYDIAGADQGSDLEDFAAHAAETLADDRGWNLGGTIAFHRVPGGGSFTLWLAAPWRVADFSPGCSADWSCSVGRNVVINERNWLGGTPAWNGAGGSLRDYRHMVVNHEVGHWLGFGHAGCGGWGQTAPVMQQQSIDLAGCGFNSWPLPHERDAVAGARGIGIDDGVPVGSVDAVQASPGGFSVGGWALDPDTAAPIAVHVYVDDAGIGAASDGFRPDVGGIFPAHGPGHGFNAFVPAGPGAHRVCTYAINAQPGAPNRLLDCRIVLRTGWPVGWVDVVAPRPGAVWVGGWALDPHTAAPVAIHVYLDDRGVGVGVAGQRRPDVGAAYPGYGEGHGFDLVVPAAAGGHRLCAYAIDAAGGDGNTLLACRDVTVPP
jgi:hypothetical protein